MQLTACALADCSWHHTPHWELPGRIAFKAGLILKSAAMGHTDCKPPWCCDGAPPLPPMRGALLPTAVYLLPAFSIPSLTTNQPCGPRLAGTGPSPRRRRSRSGNATHLEGPRWFSLPWRCFQGHSSARRLPPTPPALPPPSPPAAACRCRHSTCPLSHPSCLPAEPELPGPGEYSSVSVSGATSKMARAASFSMGQRLRAPLDNGVPGPGAFSPLLPPRPTSAAYSFHGVEDRSASRRAAEVPGPGEVAVRGANVGWEGRGHNECATISSRTACTSQPPAGCCPPSSPLATTHCPGAYSPERAERLTRPVSPGAAMHPRLDPAYLRRVDTFAGPTSYSPRRAGDSLQRGTSFSRSRGHQGTVPASHATGAATDGLGRWVREELLCCCR